MPTVSVKTLLLAGGQSTRMGTPKHLLPWLNGQPLYVDMIKRIKTACPDALIVNVSLRSPPSALAAEDIRIIYDRASDASDDMERVDRDIGPAAGLLAAHATDVNAHWLVLACDYPLLPAAAVKQLLDEFQEPITCFQNDEGFAEPLLAIWSPDSLKCLAENVQRGILGPSSAVKDLDGKLLRPRRKWWLLNTNTKAEWAKALNLARQFGERDGP